MVSGIENIVNFVTVLLLAFIIELDLVIYCKFRAKKNH